MWDWCWFCWVCGSSLMGRSGFGSGSAKVVVLVKVG